MKRPDTMNCPPICETSITWRLDEPIPAKFLKKTNKLVVGGLISENTGEGFTSSPCFSLCRIDNLMEHVIIEPPIAAMRYFSPETACILN